MKRLLSTAVLAAGLLASGTVHAGQRTVTLAVENMTCAACPFIVRKAMASVAGVAEVDVSYAEKTAVVTFDDATTTVEAVARASADAGYPAKLAGQNR
jgi:mercuric ion binding protein